MIIDTMYFYCSTRCKNKLKPSSKKLISLLFERKLEGEVKGKETSPGLPSRVSAPSKRSRARIAFQKGSRLKKASSSHQIKKVSFLGLEVAARSS